MGCRFCADCHITALGGVGLVEVSEARSDVLRLVQSLGIGTAEAFCVSSTLCDRIEANLSAYLTERNDRPRFFRLGGPTPTTCSAGIVGHAVDRADPDTRFGATGAACSPD